MQYLKVKNWEKFQHYHDRNPPWIRVYVDLLDDYEFSQLNEVSRCHLMELWLLAAKTGDSIPYDKTWIGRQISATEPVDVDDLIRRGFLILGDTKEVQERDWESRHISKSVKRAVFARCGGKCVECGSREDLEYDHIAPISKGGSGTEENIQLLCRRCNRLKSNKLQKARQMLDSCCENTTTDTEKKDHIVDFEIAPPELNQPGPPDLA